MKLYQTLITLSVFSLLISCGENVEKTDSKETKVEEVKVDAPEGWKTTSSDIFSIQHPEDWTADMEGKMGTKLFLFAPPEDSKDLFNENINLMSEKLPNKSIDLDMYVEASEKQINQFITDAKILTSKRVKMNGKEYQNVSYTGTQGELNLRFEQYYTIEDGEAFIVTFTCKTDTYEKYKEVGSKILQSFQLR